MRAVAVQLMATTPLTSTECSVKPHRPPLLTHEAVIYRATPSDHHWGKTRDAGPALTEVFIYTYFSTFLSVCSGTSDSVRTINKHVGYVLKGRRAMHIGKYTDLHLERLSCLQSSVNPLRFARCSPYRGIRYWYIFSFIASVSSQLECLHPGERLKLWQSPPVWMGPVMLQILRPLEFVLFAPALG